ncbi:hypothetical protein ACI797_04310 [Geodermatophilus sp. SYSU D00691]
MTTLAALATVAAVVLAVLGLASTAASRRIGALHLAAAGLLEAVLLVQVVVAVVGLVGGHRLVEPGTFFGYLVAIPLIPVAGVLWARTETTRWAGTVLAVAAVVVAVMVWRLVQVWEATGA